MRRQASIALLAALSFLVLFTAAAAAQITRPSADLAKENADLRAYVEKLERRIAKLEAEVKEQARRPTPRLQIRPLVPAPYGYQLPAQPFQAPTPMPIPKAPDDSIRIPPLPKQSAPDNWQRQEFNGREFYLIPLR